MYSVIIIFLINTSSRNGIRKKIINIHIQYIQSTLRTAPDFCKNGPLAVLFGSNGSSYKVCTQSDMCIYAHILHNIEMLVGKNK